MQTFYKVVTADGLFVKEFNIDNIFGIKPGTQFTAKTPLFNQGLYIQSEPPVLHIARDALHVMVWRHIFLCDSIENNGFTVLQDNCIYEVKPLTTVIQEKSQDYKIYQWGANTIEFGERKDFKEIFELAIQESKNPALYKEYSRKIKRIILSWQTGQYIFGY